MKLFDNALTVLERALDVRLYRQNVLAANVANIDTPGYKQREVDFGAALHSELRANGVSEQVSALEHATHDVQGAAPGLDQNTVDLDQTMVSMAENGLQYGAAARAASKKLAILKYVANDGNG